MLEVDEATGQTTLVREETDPAWVELVDASPDRLPDGRLVHTVDSEDTRRLAVDGQPVTPPGLQVRSILYAGPPTLVAASEEPTEVHVWSVEPGAEPRRLTSTEGLHTATAAGDVVVLVSRGLDAVTPRTVVLRAGREVAEIASMAEVPVVTPGPDSSRSAIASSGPPCCCRTAQTPTTRCPSSSTRTAVPTRSG